MSLSDRLNKASIASASREARQPITSANALKNLKKIASSSSKGTTRDMQAVIDAAAAVAATTGDTATAMGATMESGKLSDVLATILERAQDFITKKGNVPIFCYDQDEIDLRQTPCSEYGEVSLGAIAAAFARCALYSPIPVITATLPPSNSPTPGTITAEPDAISQTAQPPVTTSPITIPADSSATPTGTVLGSAVVRSGQQAFGLAAAVPIACVLMETSLQQQLGVLGAIGASLSGVYDRSGAGVVEMFDQVTYSASAPIAQPVIIPAGLSEADIIAYASDNGVTIAPSSGGVGGGVSYSSNIVRSDGFASGDIVYSPKFYNKKVSMLVSPFQIRLGKTYVRQLCVQPRIYFPTAAAGTSPLIQPGVGVTCSFDPVPAGCNLEIQLVTATHQLFLPYFSMLMRSCLQ